MRVAFFVAVSLGASLALLGCSGKRASKNNGAMHSGASGGAGTAGGSGTAAVGTGGIHDARAGAGGNAGGGSGGVGAHTGSTGGASGAGNAGNAGGAGGSRGASSFQEEAYLKPMTSEANPFFGGAIAISGDTIVAGASGDNSSAMGVNGTGADMAANSGAAFVLVRTGTTWSQQAYVKASHPGGSDAFGSAVAISGDTMVIGAPGESSHANGVNGDELDNSADQSGAAYVFVRVGGQWSQQAYLKASNTNAGDSFGSSVSISGDTIVVGAPEETSAGVGVDGDQTPKSGYQYAGAAYVFVRAGDKWSQQAYLKASNTNPYWNRFGYSVSVSGDSMIVGAPKESGMGFGVNGDQASLQGGPVGAAYVFVRAGTKWLQQAYLKPLDQLAARSGFGDSVAIAADLVVVGEFEDGAQTSENGLPRGTAGDSGAVYVFTRSGSTWSQDAYLKASNADTADEFGQSVGIDGQTIAVGAWRESSKATGVDGDQLDNSAYQSGAAYVFVRSNEQWSQASYLKADNTHANDSFGASVAISGGTVVVGAPTQPTTPQGAAYVFR